MATAFDTDLQTQFIEASTRAISASAELYTQVLTSQAEATRSLFEAFSGVTAQTARAGAETTEQAADTAAKTTTRAARTTARAARTTARATERTTRRAAGATRSAAKPVTVAATVAATEAVKAVAEPPIARYDDLPADELVAKLSEQPQAALAGIAIYEKANQNRAIVLERVSALTGPEPAPGYDELNADEAQQLVTNGTADLAAAVLDYEPRHQDRPAVIEAAVRHADGS